jgi:hypothetical protein
VNPRVSWAELPTGLRARIETAIGPVIRTEQVTTGHNCQVALTVHTADASFFLKGVPGSQARAVRGQSAEAAINPLVAPVTAPLVFRIRDVGWDVLGFTHLTGYRHADLQPGSHDLAAIAAALSTLAAIPGPSGAELRTIQNRWREYIGDRVGLLAGSVIAHTDLHRHNIMVRNGQARLVDWAWPTLAAPWVDTACAALQLITAGHHPSAAEQWCQHSPAYRAAADTAVTAFTEATQAMWHDIATQDPQPWKHDVATAAARWAAHRNQRWV